MESNNGNKTGTEKKKIKYGTTDIYLYVTMYVYIKWSNNSWLIYINIYRYIYHLIANFPNQFHDSCNYYIYIYAKQIYGTYMPKQT